MALVKITKDVLAINFKTNDVSEMKNNFIVLFNNSSFARILIKPLIEITKK